ncbi:MAG: hypothetical protein Q8R55_03350 [Candidatus Taylorbacteria bacterium]|nr:hypothetical protein [Candidatus Taylorbacteria bacterium]
MIDVWVGIVIFLVAFSLLLPVYVIALYKDSKKTALGFSFTTTITNGRIWNYLTTPKWYIWCLVMTLTFIFVPILVLSIRNGSNHLGLNMVVVAGLIYICYRLIKILPTQKS